MIHHVNLIGMTNMIGHTKVNLNAVKFSIKKVIPILIILKNMNIRKAQTRKSISKCTILNGVLDSNVYVLYYKNLNHAENNFDSVRLEFH